MPRRPSEHRATAVTLLMLLSSGLLALGLAAPVGPPPLAAAIASRISVPAPVAGATYKPARSLGRSAPARLQIPAIGVDSGLIALGLTQDGSMEVPADGFPAGWYRHGPTPGEVGPAVVAGHVDWAGTAGVFFRLRSLGRGDVVNVTRQDGTVAVFVVARIEQTAKAAFPTDAVYGDVDHPALRLVTCGGSFDRAARSYRDNIVVFADLRSVVPAPLAATAL